jgi:hypothetical protein
VPRLVALVEPEEETNKYSLVLGLAAERLFEERLMSRSIWNCIARIKRTVVIFVRSGVGSMPVCIFITREFTS